MSQRSRRPEVSDAILPVGDIPHQGLSPPAMPVRGATPCPPPAPPWARAERIDEETADAMHDEASQPFISPWAVSAVSAPCGLRAVTAAVRRDRGGGDAAVGDVDGSPGEGAINALAARRGQGRRPPRHRRMEPAVVYRPKGHTKRRLTRGEPDDEHATMAGVAGGSASGGPERPAVP
jgi:hypothetical protein